MKGRKKGTARIKESNGESEGGSVGIEGVYIFAMLGRGGGIEQGRRKKGERKLARKGKRASCIGEGMEEKKVGRKWKGRKKIEREEERKGMIEQRRGREWSIEWRQ